jgi:hypothetical protein
LLRHLSHLGVGWAIATTSGKEQTKDCHGRSFVRSGMDFVASI